MKYLEDEVGQSESGMMLGVSGGKKRRKSRKVRKSRKQKKPKKRKTLKKRKPIFVRSFCRRGRK